MQGNQHFIAVILVPYAKLRLYSLQTPKIDNGGTQHLSTIGANKAIGTTIPQLTWSVFWYIYIYFGVFLYMRGRQTHKNYPTKIEDYRRHYCMIPASMGSSPMPRNSNSTETPLEFAGH